MAVNEKFAPIKLKIDHARELIRQVHAKARSFVDSAPCEIGKRQDSTGTTYYVEGIRDVPPDIGLCAGGALHALRTALEYLVWALASPGVSPKHEKYVGFPIFDSEQGYRAGRGSKLRGVPPAAIAAIDATRPYRGGNDALWLLHELDKVDKHREFLRVAAAPVMDMRLVLEPMVKNFGVPDPAWRRLHEGMIKSVRGMQLLVRPATHTVLRAGSKLWRCGPGAQLDPHDYVFFEIAFQNPPCACGRPVIETLFDLANVVDGIAEGLKPHLA